MSGSDALLTLSAPGEAPPGLDSTGDPAFNRIWTLLHVPCASLPAATGASSLPIGVQLIGRAGADAELLSVAAWAEQSLGLVR
jgi:amidase